MFWAFEGGAVYLWDFVNNGEQPGGVPIVQGGIGVTEKLYVCSVHDGKVGVVGLWRH